MQQNKLARYITGYLVGITIFVITIPMGIARITHLFQWEIISGSFVMGRILKVLATPIFLWGIFFVVWSNIFLLIKGKGGPTEGLGVAVSPKTRHLVVEGPYRYTRNPMVFGMLSIYCSMAMALNSLSGLVAVACIATGAVIYLKMSEEKRLLNDFGDRYVAYQQEVSMIIPFLNRLL